MDLQKFIDKYSIDIDALKRIKRRIFVVGRFNHKPIENGNPEVFLFSNRSDNSKKFLGNFTRNARIEYQRFLDFLQPSIAEREKSYPGVKLISLAAPSGVRGERSRPVHANDYLYKRSISGSEQPAFAHERPPLSRDLLEGADGNRGQAILHQIQQDLATTCEFQPRSPELIETFGPILQKCSGAGGIPDYLSGGPLPEGFAEKLIDFLYDEDPRSRFSLDDLELDGKWLDLRKNPAAGEFFCDVVNAFRDGLIGLSTDFPPGSGYDRWAPRCRGENTRYQTFGPRLLYPSSENLLYPTYAPRLGAEGLGVVLGE